MLDMAQPRVQKTHAGVNYGRFVVEPLEPGYGITIGNALRRILLRSLPGAAITRVRIADVWHEFAVIEGVREDVTEIVLNLKRVRLRATTDAFRETRASLYAHGERTVRAGDIEWPSEVEVQNPDQVIATLDNDAARLEMDLGIARGRGYLPAENNEILAIGEIPVDAIFTPIQRVNYVVEHTRVGQMTDYDRLILEIMTDGTIEADDALSQAAEILRDLAQLIAEFGRQPVGGVEEVPEVEAAQDRRPLAELGLSPRVLNALRSRHIETVGQVLSMDPDQLLQIRNFGPRSLQELKDQLAEHGYQFEIPLGLGRVAVDDESGNDDEGEAEELEE